MNIVKTGMLLAALTALFGVVGYVLGGKGGMLAALGIAAATNLSPTGTRTGWRSRRTAPRRSMRDRRPSSSRWSASSARRAGLPMPRVYVIDEAQPNAFATGRNPENSAVAVSTGLLRTLTRDEVAGVIAHELAHIRNRDTLMMTVAATVAGAISTLAQFGFLFGGRGDGRPNPVVMLGTALLAPVAAMLIQFAISRSREYVADRDGAAIAGDPLGLASALRRIEAGARRIANAEAERHPATAPLFIVNPLSGGGIDSLFSTHPSTANRVAALQQRAGGRRRARAGASSTGARRSPWRCKPGPGPAKPGPRRPSPPARLAQVALQAVADVLGSGIALDDALARDPRPRRPTRWRGPSRSRPSGASARSGPRSGRAGQGPLGGRARLRAARDRRGPDPVPRRARPRRRRPRRPARDRDPKLAHLAGLVNAVLRRVARERDAILAEADPGRPWPTRPTGSPSAGARPTGAERADRIAAAHRAARALDLTVKADPAGWAERLGGTSCRPAASGSPTATAVAELPGFDEGAWWVQDAAAALPARLLAVRPGERVARPLRGAGRQDGPARRGRRPRDGARPLGAAARAGCARTSTGSGLEAETVCADALAYAAEPFDAVLLDAPCTATGTIRRHPDVAWTKRERDLARLAELQARLLDRAAASSGPAAGSSIASARSSRRRASSRRRPSWRATRISRACRSSRPRSGSGPEVVTPAGDLRTLPDGLSGLPGDAGRARRLFRRSGPRAATPDRPLRQAVVRPGAARHPRGCTEPRRCHERAGRAADRWRLYGLALREAGRGRPDWLRRQRPRPRCRRVPVPSACSSRRRTCAPPIRPSRGHLRPACSPSPAGRSRRAALALRVPPPSAGWARGALGFGWLRHLRAAETRAARDQARALVGGASARPPRSAGRGTARETRVVARRLISFLCHSPLVLNGRRPRSSTRFLARHRPRRAQLERDVATAPAPARPARGRDRARLRGAVLRGLENRLQRATRLLCAELDAQILPDGGHVSRNPGVLIDLLLDLLPLRLLYASRSLEVPRGARPRGRPHAADAALLPARRRRARPVQRHGRHGRRPVATLLSYDGVRGAPPPYAAPSGYQRLEAGADRAPGRYRGRAAAPLPRPRRMRGLPLLRVLGQRPAARGQLRAPPYGIRRAARPPAGRPPIPPSRSATHPRPQFLEDLRAGSARWLVGRLGPVLLSGPRDVAVERQEVEGDRDA